MKKMLISGNVRHAIGHLHANFVKLVSSKFGRGANMKPGLSLGSFVLFWLFASVNCKYPNWNVASFHSRNISKLVFNFVISLDAHFI